MAYILKFICSKSRVVPDFNHNIITTAVYAVIKIPSTVLPEESNYLLHPTHPNSALFKIIDVQDFIYDVRIKLV